MMFSLRSVVADQEPTGWWAERPTLAFVRSVVIALLLYFLALTVVAGVIVAPLVHLLTMATGAVGGW